MTGLSPANESSVRQVVPRFVILGFCLLGLFLRFFHLDQKLYWIDEVDTSTRISGYTFQEVGQKLSQHPFFDLETLHQYQYPTIDTTSKDTVRSLILEDAQHPPLYFLLLRRWVNLLGHSVFNVRSFSVIASLLCLPAIYWLCQELFRKPVVGEIAVLLASVSPLQVIYAQEARSYSLWLLLTTVSSAFLVRATRTRQARNFYFYTLCAIFGLYTHLLFGLVMLGHCLYVVAYEKFRLNRVSVSYFASLIVTLGAFSPWLYILRNNPPGESLTWLNESTSLPENLLRWLGIFSRTFIDLGVGNPDLAHLHWIFLGAVAVMVSLLMGLTLYGFYHLQRYKLQEAWLFMICLLAASFLPLIAMYFGFGKSLVTTRYTLPATLMVQIAIAFLIAKKLSLTQTLASRKLWKFVLVFVLACGVFSSLIRLPAKVWWNQVPAINAELPRIAQQINRLERPLIISNGEQTLTLPLLQSLGYMLAPKTQFQLLSNPEKPLAQGNFENIFVFDPSSQLVAPVEIAYKAKAKRISKWFWQIEKN
jgi:uncharacterized membrane protein